MSYFHFTLGPVQSFVAQARRTRDFWAGSFLLSYLSAVAMRAVQKQHGEILFPAANERFLAWLEGNPGDGSPKPTQGEVPNRFKARVPGGFDAQLVVDSVHRAWSELAELVWRRDIEGRAAAGIRETGTREIWTRQVETFWDMAWVLTDDLASSDLIERRKHWRTFHTPPEPGTKCMLMEGLQELSGELRPQAEAQHAFWEAMRLGRGLDFREDEHLCALAFIKRRFARHFKRFSATMPGGWTLCGWELPTHVPSVAHLAAAPWLARVVAGEDTRPMRAFVEAAARLDGVATEEPVFCVAQAAAERPSEARGLARTGADLFFEETLENPRLYEDRQGAGRVLQALHALRASQPDLGSPSPFYAVLAMDGDNLGKNLQEVRHQVPISWALERFTEQVGPVVEQHGGFLIYSGGDDVLALLPLDEALRCSLSLHQIYAEAFETTEIPSTLSGAIIYAHMRVPLTRVLNDAQQLLKDVAKAGCRRDAIAARVLTRGGKKLQWALPWEIASRSNAEDEPPRVVLEEIAERFEALSGQEVYSSKFFFKIRELFELINPRHEDHPALSSEEAVALMAAEYLGSGIHKGDPPELEEAKPVVAELLEQCRPVARELDPSGRPKPRDEWHDPRRIEADGVLLARFLARKGVS